VYDRYSRDATVDWIGIAIALLYNPITAVSLGKVIWPIANMATIAWIAYAVWRDRKAPLKADEETTP
jgi:hypothetical protein